MTPKWLRLVTQMAERVGRRLSLGLTEDQQEVMERLDRSKKNPHRQNQR